MAIGLTGAAPSPALLLVLLLTPLVFLFLRPGSASAAAVALSAGVLAGTSTLAGDARDCRLHLPDGWEGVVEGRTITRVEPPRTVPFRAEVGLPGGCRETVRLIPPAGGQPPRAGQRLRIPVRWEARGRAVPGRGEWAGRLRPLGAAVPAPGGDARGRLLALRGALQERMARLWGDGTPVVEALVLARREHLDPGVREAFALSGTAHLLAISGFHVGVVAGLLLGLLRGCGMSRSRAALGAAGGCWIYVLGIGAPDAAVRAALLLTLLAWARIRGRPVVPLGALASALLVLLVVDPGNLRSVGFQLSFAGTGGLVLLREPLGRHVDRASRRLRGRPLVRGRKARGPSESLLRGGADGLVAGTAATLPTLPLLAWHFDRISVVGIPVTLVMAPPVAAAIPGIGAALLLSGLPGGLDRFLAGGVAVLLVVVQEVADRASAWPGAAIWVSRRGLLGGGACGMAVLALLRVFRAGRVAPGVRRLAGTGAGLTAILVLPMLPGPAAGTLELHMINVGQGDALALRLPSDRWILVDAGPRQATFDAGARRVVPYLRRAGVRRLEAVVLSHPHLDHIGGAPAVLEEFEVRGVLDPSRPVPSAPWLEVLEAARARGVSWWPAVDGMEMSLDGVRFTVLHPDPATLSDPGLSDWNDLSIVLLARFGRGAVLLTGDAGRGIETSILPRLPPLSVLKAGHHGSRTSSDARLLDHTTPRVAAFPVGDGNRYGHPHPEVKARYVEREIPVVRSDRDGDVRIRIHASGTVEVSVRR